MSGLYIYASRQSDCYQLSNENNLESRNLPEEVHWGFPPINAFLRSAEGK